MEEKQKIVNFNFERIRNLVIASVAIILSVAIFLGSQSSNSSSSLASQVAESIDLETALTDDKPTLVEFYADWCTTCQAMAPDLAAIKEKYKQDVDFVMLNVDNRKWLPEVLRYRVDGIPHFVFLNTQGEAIAETIGEQPRPYLEANLDALIANSPLPYSNAFGETSQISPPLESNKKSADDPRSHG